MAEPFGQPTKQHIEKARKLYSDPILCWATNKAVETLNSMKGKELGTNYWREFYSMCRLMIKNYSFTTTYNLLEIAGEDLANDTWLGKEFVVPKIKTKEKKTFETFSGKKTISQIAKMYGVQKGKGKNWMCPFHNDKNPSLSINDKKNVFNCFGCNSKGDAIEFIRLLEEIKKNEKK